MPSRPFTMRGLQALLLALVLLTPLAEPLPSHAGSVGVSGKEQLPPPPAGRVFRVAYLETGPYWSYDLMLEKIRAGLARHGWDKAVTFPAELRFSLGWGEENRAGYRGRVREIFRRDDIDLLLSFGTEATQAALAENTGAFPIVGASISNPLAAGIVRSATDSGAPNFTTFLNTDAGPYMFIVFHQLVKFKKLGLMYNNTEVGKIYAYVRDAQEVGRERGFTVIEHDRLSAAETVEECVEGVKDLLARGAEALFIPSLNCVDLQSVDPTPIYDLLDAGRIPTFAADDRDQVKHFATMGLLVFDDDAVGLFQARQIILSLMGARPGDLSMIMPHNYRLIINLESAVRNGIDLSSNVLITTDELYLKQRRFGGTPAQ